MLVPSASQGMLGGPRPAPYRTRDSARRACHRRSLPHRLTSKLNLFGPDDFTEVTAAETKRLQFRAEFYDLPEAPSSNPLGPIPTLGPDRITMACGELRLQRTHMS